jgi:hypothetical protein
MPNITPAQFCIVENQHVNLRMGRCRTEQAPPFPRGFLENPRDRDRKRTVFGILARSRTEANADSAFAQKQSKRQFVVCFCRQQ